jgi:hypothetical protein
VRLESDDMGCGAAAHHGEKEGSRMFHREGFVLELLTIDGFAASSYNRNASEIKVGIYTP